MKVFSKEFPRTFKCEEDFSLYQNKLREYLSLYKYEVIVKEYEDPDSDEEFTVIFEAYMDSKNFNYEYHDESRLTLHFIDLLDRVDKKYYDPYYFKDV